MSAIFNTVGEALTRNANLVAANLNYTILGWARITAAPVGGQYRTIFLNKDAGYLAWEGLFTRNDGTAKLDFSLDNGGGTQSENNQAFVVNQWFNWAIVRSGNNHLYYLNGILITTLVSNFAAVVWNDFGIGDDGSGNSDVEIAYVREYNNRVLTLTEINTELASTSPVSTTSIQTSYPLQANANDDSGNGFNLTTVGAVSYQATTPLTNTQANTAVDIGTVLPFDTTQNVVDGSGVAQVVWYKYTAQPGDVEIGFWGFGDLVTYQPFTETFSPDAVTAWQVTEVNGTDNNKRLEIPVVVGNTYWFKVSPQNGAVAVATLTINILRAPALPQEIGDPFIPPDAFNAGSAAAVLIPGTNNGIRRFVYPFPFGEGGDVISNGNMLVQKGSTNNLELYDKDFTLLTTVIPGIASTLNPIVRTCKGTDIWFWGKWNTVGNSLTVKKIDGTGTIITTWTIADSIAGKALAAKNDETILYYTKVSGAGSEVKTYDLVGSAIIGTFIAAVFGYAINDILVLSDNTILVIYSKGGGTPDLYVKRFDSAGVLLNTYTFANYSGEEARIAYNGTDAIHFWIRYLINTPSLGYSRVQKIKVSDGSVITTADYVSYDLGIYRPAATTTPVSEFGPTDSCPLMILAGAATTGTIIVNKVTIPSDATLFDIVAAGGAITPTNYQLSDGGSKTHSGLAPDTYSIEETPNALYDTVISVDNGDPNTAIVLGAGDVITVTITNTLKSAATAKILVLKMTDPLNLVQLFEFTTGGGLSPATFALHSEETIEFNVVPGSGYQVIEDTYPNFKTTYMIDNDPTNNNLNITVGAGEQVSVGVLNESFGGGLFFPSPTFPGSPYPPGTGKTSDTLPTQSGGTTNVRILPFAVTGFIRDM